jgi:hypothetical protein
VAGRAIDRGQGFLMVFTGIFMAVNTFMLAMHRLEQHFSIHVHGNLPAIFFTAKFPVFVAG